MKKSEVIVATPTVVEPLPVFEECHSTSAAERVQFHLAHAREHGRCAIAHIIEAGRELALQKQMLGYGQWAEWCENNLEIAQKTADRYVETFQRTVGAARIEQGVSLDKKILKKELEAATVGMEEKTVRQAMIEIGVIKPAGSWGGARAGAGRKAASEPLPQTSAAENAKAIWAEVMRMIGKKTVTAAVALLDEKTTEVCWGTVHELYEALKDHRAEFSR